MSAAGTALITGASSGIGEAFARHLAQRGHDLVLVARREARLHELARGYRERCGVQVTVLAADLTLDADIQRVEQHIAQDDDLRVLVNNAGFNQPGAFVDLPLDFHRRLLTLQIETPLRLCHAALPGMRARREGSIINVSSTGSFVPLPNSSTYNAAKAFLNSFSTSLALENAEYGIAVQAVCPGFTRTEIWETAGVSDDDLASAPFIPWLSADEVVRESLAALPRRSRIVTPGLIYKIARRLLLFPPVAWYTQRLTKNIDSKETTP